MAEPVLVELLEDLREHEVCHVLPDPKGAATSSAPTPRLEILISSVDFQRALNVVSKYSSNTGQILQGRQSFSRFIRLFHPRKWKIRTANAIFWEPTSRRKSFRVSMRGGCVYLISHLAYKSPSSGKSIQVGTSVTESMLKNRQLVDKFWCAQRADELCYLTLYGVCNLSGNFTRDIIDRCEEVKRGVLSKESERKKFRELLRVAFFNADGLVYDIVQKGQYNTLKQRLIQFADY